jgi:hypothetical protein
VIGVVFLALFVLGMWTVWLQAETLRIGYRMEEMQRRMVDVDRASVCLSIEITKLKTPESLLDREGVGPEERGGFVPFGNVVWTAPLPGSGEMRLAANERERNTR